MKTGVIVYVVKGYGMNDNFDIEESVKRLDIKADRVEVVISGENHFDVMDAWWLLTARGMGKIVCMLAEVVSHSRIKPTGRELRLCG